MPPDDGKARAALAAGVALGAAHAVPALAQPVPAVRALLGIDSRTASGEGAALTFDDGPHPQGTAAMLETLRERGATATFFLVGEQVARSPALAAEVAAAGHGIALHCDRHRNLLRLTPRQVSDDLDRATDRIVSATGIVPELHRPPYGVYSGAGLWAVRRRGLRPLLWTHWGRDWSSAPPRARSRTRSRPAFCRDRSCFSTTATPTRARGRGGTRPRRSRRCSTGSPPRDLPRGSLTFRRRSASAPTVRLVSAPTGEDAVRRVLILSADIGSGHLVASRTLADDLGTVGSRSCSSRTCAPRSAPSADSSSATDRASCSTARRGLRRVLPPDAPLPAGPREQCGLAAPVRVATDPAARAPPRAGHRRLDVSGHHRRARTPPAAPPAVGPSGGRHHRPRRPVLLGSSRRGHAPARVGGVHARGGADLTGGQRHPRARPHR